MFRGASGGEFPSRKKRFSRSVGVLVVAKVLCISVILN